MAKKRRSPKQRAATRKLVALNRGRSAPAKRRRRRPLAAAAPARRRTRTRTVTKYRTRRAPIRRRAARRNPTARGIINTMVMPAVTQAGGAIALDVAMGQVQNFLPAQLATGPAKALVKGAVAITIGTLVGRFGRRKMGKDMGLARPDKMIRQHRLSRLSR